MSDKVKMIADGKLRQDGVWFTRGQEFECSESDAADLESRAVGLAHRKQSVVEAAVERVKRTYRRRDMTAQ